MPAPPGVRDLSTGHPDPDLLPHVGPALARLGAGTAVARAPVQPLLPELADLARSRLTADGVPAADVTVTSGTLDAVERVLAAHTRPGDRVAVEDPGWPNALDLVAALGLTPVPVPVDDRGPDPARLAAVLGGGVRTVLLTTRAQNPTGAVVDAARAGELRAVLTRFPSTLVVEDDHAAELSTDPAPLAPLAGTTRSWAFVRSVSKPFGPDLRLAVLAADPSTSARVQGRLRLGTGWVSTLLQRLVVDLWSDPHAQAAVRQAADAYRHRREVLRTLLAERGVPAAGGSGINVWVPVRDEAGAVARLLADGWAVAPGARFRLASAPGVRITVTGLRDADLPVLAAAVARAVDPRPADVTY
jgi:DNA-binding transcriptional MocR family regulator